MVVLIVGECPSCISDGNRSLRLAGLVKGRDYTEVNRYEYRTDTLFQNRADLYKLTTALLYNTETKQFINLKNVDITEQVRGDIRRVAGLDA